MKYAFACVLLALCGAVAAQTYPLQQQSPVTSGFTSGGAANCQRGWRFQCNAGNVTVTQLGCWYPDGSTNAKTVTLFDFSSQAVLAQVTCGPGSGWQWTNLSSPVTLTNGAQYIVEGFTSTASYYYHSAPGASWNPTGVIQYMDTRYANNCNANTFPTSVLSPHQYGVVDIGYTTGPNISASTSSLNLGTTAPGTAGATYSYTVSGSQTSAATTITAPTDVEVSLNQSSWSSSVQIASTGTWGPTTVYARIAASASAGTISGNITHTSTGLTTVNVSVTGSVFSGGSVTYPCQLTAPTSLTVYNSSNYNMGYKFTTSQSNVTVYTLAAVTPVAGALIVCLWDTTATSAPVGQVTTANGSAGTWRVGALSTPITLVANREYRVAVNCGPNWYYTASPSGPWTPSGVINWSGACWGSSTGNPVYPSSSNTSLYGTADIGYNTGPSISSSVSSLNLGSTPQGTAGTTQNYTVSGFQTSAATDITAPANVEIKLSTSSTWGSTINIANTGTWGPLTINARIAASAPPGSISGNITHISSGLSQVNVATSGNVTPPTITTSVTSLNLGSTYQGTAGTIMSYTVSGSGMQGTTTITRPNANVELSLNQTTWSASIPIATTGQWGPTTIYVRIAASASVGTISGNITHTSAGATTKNVALSGTVNGPTITTSTGSISLGNTYVTYTGTPVSYTVNGFILSGTTLVTAPAGVKVCDTQNGTYTQTLTISSTGTWGPTTVWARIDPATTVGAISGNITHASTGATTVNVSVSGNVNAPTIVPSVASLNLGLTSAGTAGTETSYTVDGLGTSAQTDLVAPAGVELCLTQTGTYTNTLAITTTPSYSTTVWVRISASASAGAISGNITHDSPNATTANVSVSGTVIDLQVNPTSLNLGTTPVGYPGTPQMYTLTGAGLSGNTDIVAPTGINISTTAGGTYTQTLQLTGSTINQDIYVRLDGANIGTWAGNITNTNQGVTVNVAVTGVVTNANGLTFGYNGPGSTTSVNNGDQGPGGNGLVVCDVTISTATQAWTLTDMTFTESGTVDAQTDINFVALYEDNGNGTFDGPGTDTLATAAAGTSFSGANGDYVATLTNSAFPASTTRRFFLVVKLAGTASSFETILVNLTAANGTSGGGGSINGVPTTGTVPALDILPSVLTATLNGPISYTTVNNNSQGAGGNGELICDVSLSASNETFTITSMVFTASGTADEQADINFLALYLDNGNGTFDGPGTDTLATATAGTSFNAANGTYTATITGAAASVAVGTTKRYFLVAKLAGTASPAENFKVALTSVNATSSSGGTVSGTPTAASSALVIDVPILTVNAGPANPADASVESTGSGFQHVLGEIRMTASNANFTISGVTLTLGGNGDWVNNITAVNVYQDDGNGSFDAADTQLFTGAASAGSITCGFSTNVTVNMGANTDFWVVLDVASTAGGSPSETFSASIASATDVAQVTTGTVALGTMTPNSSTLSVVNFSVISFTPIQDGFGGGAAITITGTGFGGTCTCTINGVPCTGTGVANAAGTQITGLKVPGGSGTNLAIVLTTNNLPAKTLTETFSYNFTLGGSSGGGGHNNSTQGCAAADSGNIAWLIGALAVLAIGIRLRRRSA